MRNNGRATSARVRWAAVLSAGLVMWCTMTGAAGAAGTASPTVRVATAPTVTGPVTGGNRGFPQTSSAVDLAASGYIEEEFFLAGTATAYRAEGTWGSDGRWSVAPAGAAPYVTRLLVRRPAKRSAFNGTVVVEWLNVSSRTDVDVDFGYLAAELLREGYAWVGVSAQEAGIESNGGSQFGPAAVGLAAWDPARYGSLDHPGDAFSYDIFSQAGRVLRSPGRVDPMGGLRVKQLIADGESQSAFRMVTYVNAIAPIARVYDGFLIHSRAGNAAPLDDAAGTAVPAAAPVRTDRRAPVLQVLTETDLFGLAEISRGALTPFPPARQADSRSVRTWEVAGTAHADADYLRLLSIQGTRQFPGFLDLSGAVTIANSGPQQYVMRAALHALRAWVVDGVPPPSGVVLTVGNGAIVRDAQGNALGGIRTPQLDVPVATLSGEGNSLIGKTVPFPADILAVRYPSRSDYLRAFQKAARSAAASGFVLRADLPEMTRQAQQTAMPGLPR